MVPRKGRNSRI